MPTIVCPTRLLGMISRRLTSAPSASLIDTSTLVCDF